MDRIIAGIYNTSKKKIALDELRDIIEKSSYEEFVAVIDELCVEKIIKPVVASGRNGKNPPLYMKYHINPPILDNKELLAEIKSLHHLIDTGAFLKSPEKYEKKRDMFFTLSEYLKSSFHMLDEPMSENERAYSIWHDEKLLDQPENITALKDCRIFDILNTYPTPEPFFDYRILSSPQNVLVIENKDTWFSLRKLMIEKKCGINLFGVFFDCVLYGEGKKAAQSRNSISEYLSLDSFSGNVCYWGDIDYEGINIFLLTQKVNESLNMRLFRPAYEIMLSEFNRLCVGNIEGFRCRNNQKRPADMAGFMSYFDAETQKNISCILESGLYIPQEIINYHILKRVVYDTIS